MRLDVSLQVALKGVDLVTETAYLTLAGKLGYADNLLALLRLESYAFAIECADANDTLAALRRLLAVQSTFYNRNKHNYFLDCHWDGGQHTEGVDPDSLRRRLASEASARLEDGKTYLDSQGARTRVILQDVPEGPRFPDKDTAGHKVPRSPDKDTAGHKVPGFPDKDTAGHKVPGSPEKDTAGHKAPRLPEKDSAPHLYRSEVLVEDLEETTRAALAGRLESELATTPVTVSELGTRWILALRTGSEAEAETLTREIVVTEKRDRGLLLNPNHQGYKLISLDPLI
jgi:hypothetical protein